LYTFNYFNREVWPENDIFGAISAAPEDEMLLLREMFMQTVANEGEFSLA